MGLLNVLLKQDLVFMKEGKIMFFRKFFRHILQLNFTQFCNLSNILFFTNRVIEASLEYVQ